MRLLSCFTDEAGAQDMVAGYYFGLAERRYERGDVSASYRRFFGTRRNFRQNFLKQVRRKLA